MSNPIRIAVAGLGRIGWCFHCDEIEKSDRFTMAAVCDPEQGRLEEAKERFACDTYTDYDAMLAGTELDAVVVATPTHLHRDMVVAAAKAGCHVLLEKPAAINGDELDEMMAACKDAGKVLTVYQPHRVMPPLQNVKAVIESGVIGDVYHVKRGMFRYVVRNDWQALQKFGGGMLSNYGAHALDQVLNLTGYNVNRVLSSLHRVASIGDADDVVKIIYVTDEGRIGEIDINQASTASPYDFDITGTKGTIQIRDNDMIIRKVEKLPDLELNDDLASKDRLYPGDPVEVSEERVAVDPAKALDYYDNFADAVEGTAEPIVKIEQTRVLMSVMDEARAQSPVVSH